ncbi:basement membrane-specific heparan sulfate proteoglycan core protein-like isoform X1 [Paramormyrops kingsleyae]|uniref:basement membrane-specific heparan sulfate proteoglycan core protein-like isoform X1 n=1 Tax=Paramormyrops kingsleyae TaxID=1676925 RepID=UPI003B97137E
MWIMNVSLLLIVLLTESQLGKSQTTDVIQPDPLVTSQVGDTVTLQCFYETNDPAYLSWYKQSGGWKPCLISTFYSYEGRPIFYDEFKSDSRLRVQVGTGENHLIISNTQDSDSAVYYCGVTIINVLHFGNGTLLLTGIDSKSRTVIQQPVSDTVQPGDSVTLQCTIETESCAGEHSVYWFRHGSGESLPGVIYTHGNRSDECEKSPEAGSPTQSCVYSLPKRNLSLSDAGTYYCAVAMCGEILFGNGTVVNFSGDTIALLYIVYFLGAILAVTFILFVILLYLIRRPCQHFEGQNEKLSTEENHEADRLNYAALNFTGKKTKDRNKRAVMERETLYTEVRYEVTG